MDATHAMCGSSVRIRARAERQKRAFGREQWMLALRRPALRELASQDGARDEEADDRENARDEDA
jgi:hypothetical protein